MTVQSIEVNNLISKDSCVSAIPSTVATLDPLEGAEAAVEEPISASDDTTAYTKVKRSSSRVTRNSRSRSVSPATRVKQGCLELTFMSNIEYIVENYDPKYFFGEKKSIVHLGRCLFEKKIKSNSSRNSWHIFEY